MMIRMVMRRAHSTLSVNPNLLHLRVGYITDVQFHPDADKLYVSQVSLGGDESIQVCSGLVGLVDQPQLLNSKVVVVCNLKPSKMRGVQSQGMLLCAEKKLGDEEYKVSPISEPENALAGDELMFYGMAPVSEKKRIKSKVWDSIVEGLGTDDKGRVIWKNSQDSESEATQFPLVLSKEFTPEKTCGVPSGFENCQVR